MTPPPPTPNPMPKADSGAGVPATVAELWITDAPDGMAFKCPDCESWATLGGNAAFHMKSKKHRMPKLVKLPAPPQSNPALAAAEWPKTIEGIVHQVVYDFRGILNEAQRNRIAESIATLISRRPLAPAPAPEGRGETPAAVQPIEYLTRYTCSVNGMVPAEDGPWVSFRQAEAAQDEVRESANYWNQQWNKQTGERDAAVACETKIRQYITEAMGHEACEGCDTPQLVAILISQRDNARNESDALKTAHASASRCARAAEAIELRKQLETKEQHRQYHMNAINRLAKVVGAEGEQSEDVVSVAVAAVAQARALREAATALVERIKLIHYHPLYQSVWLCALNHGVSYATGPTYEMELKALSAALAASEAGK